MEPGSHDRRSSFGARLDLTRRGPIHSSAIIDVTQEPVACRRMCEARAPVPTIRRSGRDWSACWQRACATRGGGHMVRTSRPPPPLLSTSRPAYAPGGLLASLREVPLDEPDEALLEKRRERIVPRLRQVIRSSPASVTRLTH